METVPGRTSVAFAVLVATWTDVATSSVLVGARTGLVLQALWDTWRRRAGGARSPADSGKGAQIGAVTTTMKGMVVTMTPTTDPMEEDGTSRTAAADGDQGLRPLRALHSPLPHRFAHASFQRRPHLRERPLDAFRRKP